MLIPRLTKIQRPRNIIITFLSAHKRDKIIQNACEAEEIN